MVETQQPKAIPLIAFNQKELKFEINEEAVAFVSQITGPIGVCSVAGMYRTGKSYLLNRMLLDRSNGFGVGPTINACTKGLWIWNEVVAGTSPDGDPISVLVIDTEGLGAFDETQNHDVRIFTLAILLSSYFLYNSMGSIDETSLNQLSLVVNLTKHIQLSASGCRTPGDVDPEEYSKIFPSFMWVVRDFALKLSDENDAAITSKEYLERALLEQKGFSDSVEQKNRIRRLLKTFFTERDCCTMIRPVSNETELQNLAGRDVSELRTEFQEQVKTLRRKVLGKIKPKSLNGKLLTGNLLMNLAQQYVDSINQGAVPNIESAWTYICKNECQKASDESINIFKTSLEQNVKLPCDDESITECFKTSQKAALAHFDAKVFGQDIQSFKASLKVKLQQIKETILEQNIRETQKVVSQFLSEQFQPIESSLRQGQIVTFDDLKLVMQEFVDFTEAQCPAGQAKIKSDTIKDFLTTMILQTTDQFCANFTQGIKVQLAIKEEKIKFVEGRNFELKSEHTEALESMRQSQRTLEKEKADLMAQDLQNKITLKNLDEETERLRNLNQTQISTLKQEFSQQLESKEQALQSKIVIAQEAQRQLYQVQSEGEKQIALLEQRMEFFNTKKLDLERKLASLTQERDHISKNSVDSLKLLQSNFDGMKFELSQKLEELQEKIFEDASQLAEANEVAKVEQAKLSNLNRQLKQQLSEALGQNNQLTVMLESLDENNGEKVEVLQTKLENEIKIREQLEASNKLILQETQEVYVKKITDLEKELALLEQKWNFGKEENQSLKEQLIERSQAHESILKALEDKSSEYSTAKESALQQLSTLTNDHSQTINDLKRTYECQLQQQQIIINENSDLMVGFEQRLRIESTESLKLITGLETQLQQAEKTRQQLEAALKVLERSQVDGLSKANENFSQKIAALEDEIEALTNQQDFQINEIQVKAEEQLHNLKQMYESERQRLEQRLSEEKEASRKKHQMTMEEYETRLRDEQSQREEDIEMLQSDIKENENRHQNNIKQLEYDNQLLHQTLQSNQEQYKEQEERLQRDLHISNQQLQLQNDRLQKERQEQQQKVQDLLKDDAQKEQQIASLTVQMQTVTEQNERAKEVCDEIVQKLQAQHEKTHSKIKESTARSQQLQDELLRHQLDSSREIALFKQRVDFQERKIEDLNRQLDTTIQNYEERLRQLKTDSHQEIQELQIRFNTQQDALETKFDSKRKKLKEQESSLLKKCTDAAKDKDIAEQQLQNVLANTKQQIAKFEAENQGMNEQVSRLQDQVQGEREQFQGELDRAKHQLNDIERDYCELQNTSERDKALLEGKCQFLEQQRDQAKSDYLEASRKFESTLEKLQKRGTQEKDRTETSQSAMLTSLELKFKKQLQEQIDEKQKMQFEHEENINSLQKQAREVKLELQLCDRDRQSIKRQMEVRDEESTVKEKELRQLLQNSQNDKESKSSNYLRTLERDREHLKQKFSELEIKIKDNERNKTSLLFEIEKEKAKWTMEKEQLKNKTQELNDTIEGLERQKENLLKEIEKLKSQSKKTVQQQPKISSLAGLRSPRDMNRYGGQSSTTPTHNFEPQSLNNSTTNNGGLSKSIFISGMSRALMGGNGSDTSSVHSLDLASITAPIQLKSSNTFETKSINGGATTQKSGSGRVNVINFDLTRTKARLSNITNTVRKPLEDQE